MVGLVLAASLVFAGCETIKGMGKDIGNLFGHVKKAPSTINSMDAKMREVLW
jgi:predicted small secreted protein